MPYRRLPNTDQARLRALNGAIQKTNETSFNEQFVSFKTINEAKSFLSVFEKQLFQYQQTWESQVSANRRYKHIMFNAHMYISHFIQVFNLSVIRGDIKKEYKALYGLDMSAHILPDLSTEAALLKWGKCIIDGENERMRKGGIPIYNPTIAKVKVHYDIFKEYQATQKFHQSATARNWEELNSLREKADAIILDIWNQVEEHFANCKPYDKLCKCKEYGLIYYYRRGEKELTPASDIETVDPNLKIEF